MGEIVIHDVCRVCGHSLVPIISLGEHYVTNFVNFKEEFGLKVPLELVLCNEDTGGCGLLQLKHTTPSDALWDEQYWYKSAINPTIRNDLQDVVTNVKKMVDPVEGDIYIDVGANDGTLLSFYDMLSIKLVGFEPSKNVAREAAMKGFEIINNFFNATNFKERFGDKKAKVITAISMFYDLEDPNQFLQDVVSILDKDGLFIVQQNYLPSMLEQNAVDNVCHEHLEYYSLRSFQKLLDRHGLEVFDIVLHDLNGGSIRAYIKFKASDSLVPYGGAKQRMDSAIQKELSMKLNTPEPYLAFANRLKETKEELVNFIKEEVAKGKVVCAAGASTRGNTTLQYLGLGPELITAIADKNPDKDGKRTVGSFIPIDSPEKVMALKPDYLLVIIWYFFHDVRRNQKEFFENGGKFILPFPEFRVIGKN